VSSRRDQLDAYTRAVCERIPWAEGVATIGGREYPMAAVVGAVLGAADGLGLLTIAPPPDQPVPEDEAHAAARFLVAVSGLPRYSDAGLGWPAILTSPANLENCGAAAAKAAVDRSTAEAVAANRAVLRRYQRQLGHGA